MTKIQMTETPIPLPAFRNKKGTRSRWNSIIPVIILVFGWSLFPAAALSAGALETATFIPQWLPQAQFAGYYVALEKGFYRRLGLEVRILPGGPERPASEWLERGLADFGSLMLAQAVKKRAEGVKLVHIGQVVQRSSLYNEYHLILNAGLNPEELTTFPFSDQDLNFPEDGLYCLEKTFLKNPERACRFVRASLEGWQYAFDHQEEALDIVMKYAQDAHQGTNRTHQRWMLQKMRELVVPTGAGRSPGTLAEGDYERVGQTMLHQGLISAIPSPAEFRRHCPTHGK